MVSTKIKKGIRNKHKEWQMKKKRNKRKEKKKRGKEGWKKNSGLPR